MNWKVIIFIVIAIVAVVSAYYVYKTLNPKTP